jgi:hypothetical protein
MGLDEELFKAVTRGDVARVRELLKKGANVNAREKDYSITVHFMVFNRCVASARACGLSPLHWAAAYGFVDVVKILLEHGADVNPRNVDGITPLHLATVAGHVDVARILLEHGADVNTKNEDNQTPLHYAAIEGHAVVARLLLEHGADPSIRDRDGKTPLDIARKKKHKEVVRVIEEFVEQGRRGRGVGAVATSTSASDLRPLSAFLSIIGVECPGLRVGEWGRLLVRVRGSGTATLSLEGDVDWINTEAVEVSGEAVVEVPVKPRVSGEIPVKVRVESSGSKSSKIVWLKVVEKAGKCPACGAPAEPGAKYCWKCGAKLD